MHAGKMQQYTECAVCIPTRGSQTNVVESQKRRFHSHIDSCSGKLRPWHVEVEESELNAKFGMVRLP